MPDLATALLPAVRHYLDHLPRVLDRPIRLQFLAQGEYNLNYLATAGDRQVVVRLNTGSQEVAAGAQQILYEAAALRLVAPTGIAPRLLHVDAHPEGIPHGLLVEEYLPGRPLEYGDPADLRRAAGALARLHAFRSPDAAATLLVIDRPLSAYLAFGRDMVAHYRSAPGTDPTVLCLLATVEQFLERAVPLEVSAYPLEERGIVHTDVQAHNFIIAPGETAAGEQSRGAAAPGTPGARLVDWEKPMVDDPTYDLCHFLAPTTTRWKCGVTLDGPAQGLFLEAYVAARAGAGIPVTGGLQGLERRRRLRQPFVHWRAITWCAMAWVEYARPDRPLRNEDTRARIDEYLQADFLEGLFAPALDGTAWRG
ncbi:MAG: aminoglycoside phosphotransferase family protein [Chloroflexota bacterium]|nr:aminoglycoside phosphotransferase family protein [Chloroflexota bacterium]